MSSSRNQFMPRASRRSSRQRRQSTSALRRLRMAGLVIRSGRPLIDDDRAKGEVSIKQSCSPEPRPRPRPALQAWRRRRRRRWRSSSSNLLPPAAAAVSLSPIPSSRQRNVRAYPSTSCAAQAAHTVNCRADKTVGGREGVNRRHGAHGYASLSLQRCAYPPCPSVRLRWRGKASLARRLPGWMPYRGKALFSHP